MRAKNTRITQTGSQISQLETSGMIQTPRTSGGQDWVRRGYELGYVKAPDSTPTFSELLD